MSVLLTGGLHAKTSVHIGSLLQRASIPFALASQHGPRSLAPTPTEFSHAPLPAVNFDYEDISTWEAIFSTPPGGVPIAAVWLLVPEVDDPEAAMEHFVDYCLDRGARRFVLCADTTTKIDHSIAGKAWRMLADRGVEYVVLRPTWYMDNFSHGFHLPTIKSENKIYTCAKNGRCPLVADEDVAALAFHALTDAHVPNTDWKVLGPDLLSHTDIAAILSQSLERKIVHKSVSPDTRHEILTERLGLPPAYSQFIVYIENLTLEGEEEISAEEHAAALGNYVRVVGKKPTGFREFIDRYRACWK